MFDRRSTPYAYVAHISVLSFSVSSRREETEKHVLTTVSVHPVTTLGVKSVHLKLSVDREDSNVGEIIGFIQHLDEIKVCNIDMGMYVYIRYIMIYLCMYI